VPKPDTAVITTRSLEITVRIERTGVDATSMSSKNKSVLHRHGTESSFLQKRIECGVGPAFAMHLKKLRMRVRY
jgi:hypothetical protein